MDKNTDKEQEVIITEIIAACDRAEKEVKTLYEILSLARTRLNEVTKLRERVENIFIDMNHLKEEE